MCLIDVVVAYSHVHLNRDWSTCCSLLQRKQADEKSKAELLQEEQSKAMAQLLELMDTKKIEAILNISAHVYRLPDCVFSSLGETLVVLQLGRWWNSDGDTYMEVVGLETLGAIGNLKKLRYLGIRGLSNLTQLPREVGQLQQLVVQDIRGCQNLARVSFSPARSKLRRLTHLDLTECYMLEHIGREMITSLSELKVFKGFVFSTNNNAGRRRGKQKQAPCRLRDLGAKMKKLQKLSINVTSDANVGDQMAHLKSLVGLRKLTVTVTWGELPTILKPDKKAKQREELLRSCTNLKLPPQLEKLDVRCYPEEDLSTSKMFEKGSHDKLTKLTGWTDIRNMMKNLRRLEVVVKDTKVMKYERKHQVKDPSHGVKPADEAKEEERDLMTRAQASTSTSGEEQPKKDDLETGADTTNHDLGESNVAPSKMLQAEDRPEIKATTNDEYSGIGSIPYMEEQGIISTASDDVKAVDRLGL
ncbi:hypothetical protein GUJ93_ZPchr0006g46411 [Zizania palustris]|uniref:Disease resistance R13L4/SHOC-2-like LRR domain-containing protein n=1 Tax=Zizania palustris TaxID=103762 RepID=A0A8J5SKA3_ZIZPA|nr:hypothetical protein GUJ93_ZPchr0006g46411 [Zizania palustris]